MVTSVLVCSVAITVVVGFIVPLAAEGCVGATTALIGCRLSLAVQQIGFLRRRAHGRGCTPAHPPLALPLPAMRAAACSDSATLILMSWSLRRRQCRVDVFMAVLVQSSSQANARFGSLRTQCGTTSDVANASRRYALRRSRRLPCHPLFHCCGAPATTCCLCRGRGSARGAHVRSRGMGRVPPSRPCRTRGGAAVTLAGRTGRTCCMVGRVAPPLPPH